MSLPRKLVIGAVVAAIMAYVLAGEIPYRMELGRRHHQIGQLWTFCVLYYCPRHGGHFPSDLNELRRVPEFAASSEYWERALSEIELTAPGARTNDAGAEEAVVFRERKADDHGIRAYHEVGGSYGFMAESAGTEPKMARPYCIGG